MTCQDRLAERQELTKGVEKFGVPVIVDTLESVQNRKVANEITLAYRPIVAIKEFGDTCRLDMPNHHFDSTVNRMVEQRADGLQLLVDTSQNVTIKYDKEFADYVYGDSTQLSFKGYPVFVYNETSSIKWLMAQDGEVMAIQEAMDSSYNWRPIEIWPWSWCGNSFYRTYIKPNHYLLFKMPIYKGDFYTDMRLKVYSRDVIIYSNEYKGWISYSQFNLPKKFEGKNGKPGIGYGFLNDRE